MEKLREKALELVSEVRAKISAVQCVHFKDGIGMDYAELVKYDDMLGKIEDKMLFESIHVRSKTDREDMDELLELVMFINLMEIVSKGFDKGEIIKHKMNIAWV